MPSPVDDLYFVLSPALNRIKIGRGKDPASRLADLRVGSPDPDLCVLATVRGKGHLENEVHKAWAALWSHGEWFAASDELKEWIAAGCDMTALKDPIPSAGVMIRRVSRRHNPRHIEAMLASMTGRARQ